MVKSELGKQDIKNNVADQTGNQSIPGKDYEMIKDAYQPDNGDQYSSGKADVIINDADQTGQDDCMLNDGCHICHIGHI